MRGYAVKTLFAVASVSTLIGCSSVGVQSQARTASDEATRDANLDALRVQVAKQEEELEMLRSQLALARAEVQELKGARDLAPDLPETVPSVAERLPTTANVPDLPEILEPEPSPPVRPVQRAEVSIEGYRRGLSLLGAQKFQEALVELDAFASAHPSHPYADNALFWCGEIHYLRHEYDQALRYFERVEKLYPWGNKTPDALYRMGHIYLRRGDTVNAQAYFNKVREQFPDTAAARLALREDAS